MNELDFSTVFWWPGCDVINRLNPTTPQNSLWQMIILCDLGYKKQETLAC
jgi:hypothetical protein